MVVRRDVGAKRYSEAEPPGSVPGPFVAGPEPGAVGAERAASRKERGRERTAAGLPGLPAARGCLRQAAPEPGGGRPLAEDIDGSGKDQGAKAPPGTEG